MKIDITFCVTPQIADNAQKNEKRVLVGHLGTHFDVMDKEFPLDYTERKGIVFDVSTVKERDIDIFDIDMDSVEKNMFVAFYTGFIEEEGYGTEKYFHAHPQLSEGLIEMLLEKEISIIGVDFAGIRRGKEHPLKDKQCADRGTFVVENLCSLKKAVDMGGKFLAHTYPMKYAGVSGLPCRVIAEIL